MRILHYSLGLPPYRTGGLTKYSIDLMLTHIEKGHDVALLWPGQIKLFNHTTQIRKRKSWKNIHNFELINPLPVSLDEGILDINAYMKSSDIYVYIDFLKKFHPDVIHIHTLMGIHKEFFQAASILKIRTVFTTHDYFGICPKVTLYHNGIVCDDDHRCFDCINCNQTALSLKKIMLLQSPLYKKFKNTKIIKYLRKYHREQFFKKTVHTSDKSYFNDLDSDKFAILRNYYISIYKKIDFVHFNSTLTETVYKKYFRPNNSMVIPVTHRDIKDFRKEKVFSETPLHISYLGPTKPFKGFQFLIEVLDELWKTESNKFELHIFSETNIERIYITHKQAGYRYQQLAEIFNETDLVVVPSQWYETFGFNVLEALSYGVPVLVTNNVGAKDLVRKEFIANTNLEFKEKLRNLIKNRALLADNNKFIVNEMNLNNIQLHEQYIEKFAYGKTI